MMWIAGISPLKVLDAYLPLRLRWLFLASLRRVLAKLFPDRQTTSASFADRMDAAVHRGSDPHCGCARECDHQHQISRGTR